MKLALNVTWFLLAIVLGETCYAQPEPTTCLVIVDKTCADVFGPLQGVTLQCEEVPCANADYCTTGEPLPYFFPIIDEPDYSTLPIKTSEVPAPGASGNWWGGSVVSAVCSAFGACKYECKEIPGLGNRCQASLSHVRNSIYRPKTKYEPCTMPPEVE
jgi:hypothetical protein